MVASWRANSATAPGSIGRVNSRRIVNASTGSAAAVRAGPPFRTAVPFMARGSMSTTATDRGDFGVLTASVMAMTISVVCVNRVFWRKLYAVAEERFSLNT